jgi:hypothetical protein
VAGNPAIRTIMSPTLTPGRRQEAPSHSYNSNTDNLFDEDGTHNGQTSSSLRNILNVHDMLQPILSLQNYGLGHEQPPINMVNTVNVHDMIQPILPAHVFASFDEQTCGDMPDLTNLINVHDMLQPILPAQICDLLEVEPQTSVANTVDVHNIGQQILPARDFTTPGGQTRSLNVECAGMTQSSPSMQAPRAGGRQLLTQSGHLLAPQTIRSQFMSYQNPSHGALTQPVSAA